MAFGLPSEKEIKKILSEFREVMIILDTFRSWSQRCGGYGFRNCWIQWIKLINGAVKCVNQGH